MRLITEDSCALALLAAALWIGVSGCGQPSAAQQPADSLGAEATSNADGTAAKVVTAGPPQRKTLRRTTMQPGHVSAFETTPVYPKVSGYVERVHVDIGDTVEKDQVLIELWVPEMQDDLAENQALIAQAEAEIKQARASVRSAQAAVQSAQARVAEAEAGRTRADAEYERWQSEYQRLSELADNGSVSRKLVDEARHQYRSAEAAQHEVAAKVNSAQAALEENRAALEKARADQVAAEARLNVAQAELQRARTMLDYTQIKAPFAGAVTQRNVHTGHFVEPGRTGTSQPLLVVARMDKLRIFVDIPEMETPLVDIGDLATIRVQALPQQPIEAEVIRTSWALDVTNRSLTTEIDIDNADGKVRPGMYALADILLEERSDVLTLPVGAVVRASNRAYCYCVENGTLVRTPIELGLRVGDEFEIASGLSGDRTVVLARVDSLSDGQAVEVAAPESP